MSAAVCDSCPDVAELKNAVTDQRLRCNEHEFELVDAIALLRAGRVEPALQKLEDVAGDITNARLRRAAEYPRPMGAL